MASPCVAESWTTLQRENKLQMHWKSEPSMGMTKRGNNSDVRPDELTHVQMRTSMIDLMREQISQIEKVYLVQLHP